LAWIGDERIVYTANPSQNIGLFIMDADGGNARQLSFDKGPHADPAVCEGGHTVVYGMDFEGAWHIWKLDVLSGASTKLTSGPGEIGASCISGADTVVYKGQISDGQAYIFKVPLSGGTPARLSERVALTGPLVSPNGHHILFPTLSKDGSVIVVIVSAENGTEEASFNIPATLDANCRPTWTPDSRALVLGDLRTGASNLFVFPVFESGQPRQLTHFSSGSIWNSQWSASGKKFAMARGTNASDVVLFTEAQ